MHTGQTHESVTGQRQAVIRRRDQFPALMGILISNIILLVIADGRITSLVNSLTSINSGLGVLRPILNLIAIAIVSSVSWVVWRKVLEQPIPTIFADRRVLGIPGELLIYTALLIASIQAGKRWLPGLVKTEMANFSLPLGLLILASVVWWLAKTIYGRQNTTDTTHYQGGGNGHDGHGRGPSWSVTGLLQAGLTMLILILIILGALWIQRIIWANGQGHKEVVAIEADRRSAMMLSNIIARAEMASAVRRTFAPAVPEGLEELIRDVKLYPVTLGPSWSREFPLSINDSVRFSPPNLAPEILINEEYILARVPGIETKLPDDIRTISVRLTNGETTDAIIGVGKTY